MSELGEYYQDKRTNDSIKKEKFRSWNTQIVDGLSIEYDFTVVKHTDYHFSLYHPTRGIFDYYPSTNKGGWFHGNKMYGRPISIPDIESYLIKNFNPNE